MGRILGQLDPFGPERSPLMRAAMTSTNISRQPHCFKHVGVAQEIDFVFFTFFPTFISRCHPTGFGRNLYDALWVPLIYESI